MARRDLVIISDLHLGDGSRREDFGAEDEQAFTEFADEIATYAPVELVINGDFIDFAQIQPRPQMWLDDTLGATEQESIEKLECAMEAHSGAFSALERLVARGGTVRFLYGNLDIDLVWPRVQAVLRSRLGDASRNHSCVQFGWLYATGGVYIEHGHQADPPNDFVDMRSVVHADSLGVPRLERCWGTRLVEEFFNELDQLDGMQMLDNVRPTLQAAALIIGDGLMHPAMYPALRGGLEVLWQPLATLRTDADVRYASEQAGIPIWMLRLLAGAAGFFGVQQVEARSTSPRWVLRAESAEDEAAQAVIAMFPTSEEVASPRSAGAVAGQTAPIRAHPVAPTLHYAYRIGRRHSGDPKQLHHELQALPSARGRNQAVGATTMSGASAPAGEAVYYGRANQRYLQRACRIGAARPGLAAICFGHTHLATDARLRVDEQAGWPLPETTCRYYNSGSWTRSINLQDPRWRGATFEELRDPASSRSGRDLMHVHWDERGGAPEVAIFTWDALRGERQT